nr:ABC transporter ATP-binding protein [Serinicoccus chungangensis]
MRDFPPTVTAWTPASTPGHRAAVGVPDTRGPVRFLWWLLRQQPDLVLVGCLCSLLWMLPTALTPWVFGQAIDEGILGGDSSRTALWCGVLLLVTVVGASSGVFYHTVVVRSWLYAAYGQTRLVTHQATRLGHVLPRRAPTGEVLSVNGSDGDQFGHFIEIFSRLVGNVVAYVLVAFIVLQMSVPLGLVVLLVAPVLVLISSVLLRPLAAAQTRERSRDSELTSMATDIVAGLRILRGIGGERIFGDNYARQSQRVRHAGVQAGAWGAFVEGVGVLLSGLFVVALMVLGVQRVREGDIEIGELVAFLGYALFLVQPIRVVFEAAQQITRSVVSARKTIGVFGTTDPWPRRAPLEADQVSSLAVGELVDDTSGLRVRPGLLTMVVSALPDESARLADRLGRYLPAGDTVPAGDDEATGRVARRAARSARGARTELEERDTRRADGPWASRWAAPTSPTCRWTRCARWCWSATRRPRLRGHAAGRGRPATAGCAASRPRPRCTRPRRGRLRTSCPAAGRACSTSAGAGCPAVSASASCSPARSPRTRRCSSWSSRPRRWTRTPRRGSPSGCPGTDVAGRPSSSRPRRCCCTTPTRWPSSRTGGWSPPAPTTTSWPGTRHTVRPCCVVTPRTARASSKTPAASRPPPARPTAPPPTAPPPAPGR